MPRIGRRSPRGCLCFAARTARHSVETIDDSAWRHTCAPPNGWNSAAMDQTIIIGSGMAGISCARALAEAGVTVRVLDKGRGIGGRMATRRVSLPTGDLTFDHGAQYMRPRDAAFAQALAAAGSCPWPDGTDHGRHVGVPGMSSVPRAMAAGLNVAQQTEVSAMTLRDGVWHLMTPAGELQARRVILTIPAPQAARLLGPDHPFAPHLARVTMAPCLTLMAAFAPNSARPFVQRRDPDHDLAWIAQDSAKPGRADAAVTWVAQAGPAFSRARLESSTEDMTAPMLRSLAEVLGADPSHALHARVHRWRYAQASTALGQPFLRDDARSLFVGGDWCLGARAEDAWHSGRAIAQDILNCADVL